jgi:hypothetical protein
MLAAMSSRLQRVRLETSRHLIEGHVQMPTKGFRSRVTDFFNANTTEFVALTDAVITPLDGSAPPAEHPFVAVSTRHVVLVIELELELEQE